MAMRSTGDNLLKVRARALTALMPPLRLRLSEWIEKISARPKACRHCPARCGSGRGVKTMKSGTAVGRERYETAFDGRRGDATAQRNAHR